MRKIYESKMQERKQATKARAGTKVRQARCLEGETRRDIHPFQPSQAAPKESGQLQPELKELGVLQH